MNWLPVATVGKFTRITQKVIAHERFDHYLPTALCQTRAHIAALEGVPDGADLETIALERAA